MHQGGYYLLNGRELIADDNHATAAIAHKTGREVTREEARAGTMAHHILMRHATQKGTRLNIAFDMVAAHDINAVSIIQSARASGMEQFALPTVITNCHNALCAVGGTINEDDHRFLLSACKKYGGYYLPPSLGVIHQFMRETQAACGSMILASDSHTRYGPMGTLAVGEGGGEIVKQLLGKPYVVEAPEVVAVYLTGAPSYGVGSHDVALEIIAAVFPGGFVKNRVMEFIGDGVKNLSMDFRAGIDTMTTETSCWSSIWQTDDKVRDYFALHGRPQDFRELAPAPVAYYDRLLTVDLSKVRPMIAMPFHPSEAYAIADVQNNLTDILGEVQKRANKLLTAADMPFDLLGKIKGGKLHVDQGVITGCAAGSFENITTVADIMEGCDTGNGSFYLSVYPASQPIYLALAKNGAIARLMESGVLIKPAFCGPCFGAGDIPANGDLCVRHVTRNFHGRDGSILGEGQLSAVALMDARSIAATARNKGVLTAADQIGWERKSATYYFDSSVYEKRAYNGIGNPRPEEELRFGPNIRDWPALPALPEVLVLKVVSVLEEEVTTTDDLLPADASSYRSNPEKVSAFALRMKDPGYVGRAMAVRETEQQRNQPGGTMEIGALLERLRVLPSCKGIKAEHVAMGSLVCARRIGDGSAREQAASCQKVLGTWANLADEYTTKRYASNLKNWGILPLLRQDVTSGMEMGDYLVLIRVREELAASATGLSAVKVGEGALAELSVPLLPCTPSERQILLDGGLINHYRT